MGLKGKIISTCLMIALTLCSAVAIGFAYSNPGINISSPTSFNVDAGVQADISTTLLINGEEESLGENVGKLSIIATSSDQSYNINLPERSFSKSGDTITYTFTIKNTKTETVGSNFKVSANYNQPAENINECVSITSTFDSLTDDQKQLENDETVSISFTITLLSESTTFEYDPSISFTLTKM